MAMLNNQRVIRISFWTPQKFPWDRHPASWLHGTCSGSSPTCAASDSMKPWSAPENPSKMVEFMEFSDDFMVYDWNMVKWRKIHKNGDFMVFHGIWLEYVVIYTLYCVIKHGTSPPKKMEKIGGNDAFYYGNNGEILATIIVGNFCSGDVHEILMTWKITIYWGKMMMNPLMEWVPIFKHALKYYMVDPVMGVEIENLRVKHRATLSSTTYMCIYIYIITYTYHIHIYIYTYICCICC